MPRSNGSSGILDSPTSPWDDPRGCFSHTSTSDHSRLLCAGRGAGSGPASSLRAGRSFATIRYVCTLLALSLQLNRIACNDQLSIATGPSQLVTPKGYMIPQGLPIGLAGEDMAGGLEVTATRTCTPTGQSLQRSTVTAE